MLNAEMKKKLIEEVRAARMRRKNSARISSSAAQQRKLDDKDNIQEERYKTLIENIPCAVYSAFPGKTGPTTFISNKWKDWTGYSPEELYEDPEAWTKCIHTDDREKAVNTYAGACIEKTPYNLEYRVVHKDTGQVRYVRDQGLVSKDEKGDIIRVDGIVTDITELKKTENELKKHQDHLEKLVKERTTELSRAYEVLKLEDAERKKAEETLRMREQILRAFLNAPTQSAILVDIEGTILDINSIAAQRLGKSIEELIGMGIYEYLPTDIAEYRKAQGDVVIRSGKPVRFQDERGGRYYDNNVYPVFDDECKVSAIAIFSEDITERKKTEEMLRKSENRLREAQRVGAVGDWEFCVQTQEITWSEEVYRLFERDPAKGPPTFEESMVYYYPEDSKILQEQVSRAIDFGEEFDTDYHLKLPSGKSVYRRGLIRTVKDDNGKVVKLYGTVQDITEHKRAEQALLESEKKFRSLFEDAIQPIVVFDRDGVILMINPPGAENLKLSCKECVGRSIRELLPDLTDDSIEVFRQVIDSGKEMRTEKVVELPIGRKWFLSILQPVYNMSGTAYAVQVSSYDITESKQVEEALKESAEKYRRMEANIPGMVYTYAKHPDGSHSMPYANSASRNLFGIEPEDLMRDVNLLSDLIHPDDRERRDESIKLSAETLQPWRQELRYIVNGQVRWYDCRSRPQRQPNGDILWDGIMLETTERKQANEALRESEEKFRSLAEQSPNMIFIYSKGRIAYANKTCEEIMEYKREEFYSPDFDFLTLIAPESMDLIKKNFARHLEGKDVQPYDYSLINKQGERIEAINASKLIQYEGELAILGIVTDITERKKAEQTLRESEERLKILFESAPDAIYLMDFEGRFVDGNIAAEELIGYEKSEVIGMNLADTNLMSAEHLSRAITNLKKAAAGKPTGPNQYTLQRKDGSYVDIEVRTFPVKIGDEMLVLGMARDITERKCVEQKFIEYQAQLKTFASQLSLTEERERRRLATELHDQISQSLVISKIKLDQIRKSSASGELTEALEEVCNCLRQVIDDTRTLTFDLSSPILYELGFEAAVAEWLAEQIQEKHGIKTEFEDDGKQKPLDDDIQALLFRNVRELLINIVKHAQAQKVKLSVRRIDEHIHVSVEDDGEGFDPVEVTSTAAQKAKFGLFSIRERLEQLGGFLEIKSEPGHGSKITMTAPLKQTNGVRV